MHCSALKLLVAMTFSTAVLGSAPTPEDFAFGFTVDSKHKGALWELELPEAVYRSVTDPDLGDMRVFNQAGLVVPHALRLPSPVLTPAPVSEAIPFFPLYSRAERDAAGHALRIITDEAGAIVDATSETVPAHETELISAYLLDASALAQPPYRLKLTWKRPRDAGFAVAVEVEFSDDLSHWQTLVTDVTLADLRSGEAVLTHDEIELPERKAKYLRIAWPEELREVTITGVLASFRAEEQPLLHRWIQIVGVSDKGDARAYDFDAGGRWPVDRARVGFARQNVVVQAALMSRPGQEESWRTRYSGVFYTLDYDGTVLEGAPIEFSSTSDRYWRLKLADKERELAAGPLTLTLGWVPHLLTFVAQGEAPYTVAFGSTVVTPAAGPVDTLLRAVDVEQAQRLIVPARASSIISLGGEVKLEPPSKPFPWKKLVLWAVLLAGVALLAWMVLRLSRQTGA